MLLVQQVQVRMTAKDGTRLLVTYLHTESYTNPNGNERHQIPGKQPLHCISKSRP
jgi:hypothetical protein